MKIFNLYAGIGGNRRLWGDKHDITAIEINPEIAKIYKDFYPCDKVIVTDAHQYLLEHYKEYDFIWSSPPCPTHSDAYRAGTYTNCEIKYADMTLYQEIILLTHFAKNIKWVVENVRPYYKPLIINYTFLHRHLFWNNFSIPEIKFANTRKRHVEITGADTIYGFNISKYKVKNKTKILRNMVNPEIGKYILEQSQYTGELF